MRLYHIRCGSLRRRNIWARTAKQAFRKALKPSSCLAKLVAVRYRTQSVNRGVRGRLSDWTPWFYQDVRCFVRVLHDPMRRP
jgi:hypothetical protein